MKKVAIIATALVLSASAVLGQPRRQPGFANFKPASEKIISAFDSSLVGARNIMRVTGGDSPAAAEYAQFVESSLPFFKGKQTGREICETAMIGQVVADSVGGIDFTLAKAVESRTFDCENFVIVMFDIARKLGKAPFVDFVDGHVILEIDGWCIEVDGASGRRRNYHASLLQTEYDTVYLRTSSLGFFADLRLAAKCRADGDFAAALTHCNDAIHACGRALPEPYYAAWKNAKSLGLLNFADLLAEQYQKITGVYPGHEKAVKIR